MKSYQVQKFIYNGFAVIPPKGGWGQIAEYTAQFKEWTHDPGIMKCKCSDGKERLIPSSQLIDSKEEDFPKQDMSKKVLFGEPCKS